MFLRKEHLGCGMLRLQRLQLQGEVVCLSWEDMTGIVIRCLKIGSPGTEKSPFKKWHQLLDGSAYNFIFGDSQETSWRAGSQAQDNSAVTAVP